LGDDFELEFIGDKCDEHNEGSFALHGDEVVESEVIVGDAIGSAEVVSGAEDLLDSRASANGSNEAFDAFGEGEECDIIALSEGDIAEHDSGVECVIEQRDAIEFIAHEASAVEHNDDILVAFDLKFAGDELSLAGGGFPVDLSDFITVTIFAESFEFSSLSWDAYEADADFGESISAGHEFAFVDGADIGVDANRSFEWPDLATVPESEP
jgi:hypothetical protein